MRGGSCYRQRRVKILAIVMLLSAAAAQAAPHHRAAGHPSGCSLTIAPRAVELPAAGGSATISVVAQGSCAWSSKANDGWILANDTPSGVVVTVTATTQARSGSIDIAGFPVVVTQTAPPNLLTNGSFDHDLSGWSTTYSTGSGFAAWVAGSAQITSTQPLTGYQLIQCANVTPGTTIDAGVRVMIPAGQDASGYAVLGVYELLVRDCTNTAYTNGWRVNVRDTGAWGPMPQTIPLRLDTLSVLFVMGGGGEKVAPFRFLYDDAYIRVH